jgi:hypothetical protein
MGSDRLYSMPRVSYEWSLVQQSWRIIKQRYSLEALLSVATKLVKFAFELEGKFLSRGKAGRGKRERT